jgi:Fe-S-cluster-containing hydrogenase component 2
LSRIGVDATLCRDCQICTLACSLYHEGVCSLQLARLAVIKDMERYRFRIVICEQCESPACVAACPVDALEIDERGVVVLVEDVCIQCGACVDSCPYDAIFQDEATGRYFKCDLCAGRAGGPLCVERCPTGALILLMDEGES